VKPCLLLVLPHPCLHWKYSTNSQAPSWYEGEERVSLKKHEEENEEELIFLDIFHMLPFVVIFYG